MIEAKVIRNLSDRYQTTVENVIREYFQHLFLSALYQQKDSEKLLFKGGTALRIIWHSPRFSEDLDFTGTTITVGEIETLIEKTLVQIEQQGVHVVIDEAKKTSGGYFAIIRFQVGENQSEVQLEVSLRKKRNGKGVAALITSDFVPPFTLIHLEEKILVGEKVSAVLTRSKTRDFYDLYFILRNRMGFKEVFGSGKVNKRELLEKVTGADVNLKSELKRLLPSSQHMLLKNFKTILVKELERNLP